MTLFCRYWLIATVCVILSVSNAQAQELKVAVASNFYHSLYQLIKQSELANKVVLSSGSSGLLYAQIKKGAPFDVFLSADSHRPQLLAQQGFAFSPQTYAIGELVLWPAVSNVQSELANLKGKLAVANPKLAPYGEAAVATLHYLGLEKKLQSQLVKANNVNQAFQFVDSGNAQLAILSKAQLKQAIDRFGADKGYENYQSIPSEWHQQVVQQMVILKRTNQLVLAQQFTAWLLSESVQQKLTLAGYRGLD